MQQLQTVVTVLFGSGLLLLAGLLLLLSSLASGAGFME